MKSQSCMQWGRVSTGATARHPSLLGHPAARLGNVRTMAGRVLTPTVEVPVSESEYAFVTAHLQVSMPPISPDSVVKVIGSCEALGNWQPESAPSLQCLFGDLWSGDISVTPGTHVFKIVILNQQGIQEEDANKVMQVPECPGWLRVTCQWGSINVNSSFLPEELKMPNDDPAALEARAQAWAQPEASTVAAAIGTASNANRSRRASRERSRSSPTARAVEAAEEVASSNGTERVKGKSPSAYNIFVGEKLRQLKEERPDLPHRNRMKLANELWRQHKEAGGHLAAEEPQAELPAAVAAEREEFVRDISSRWARAAAAAAVEEPPAAAAHSSAAAESPAQSKASRNGTSSSSSSTAVSEKPAPVRVEREQSPPAVTPSSSSNNGSSNGVATQDAARGRAGSPSWRAGSPGSSRTGSPSRRSVRPERTAAPPKPMHPFEVFAQEQMQVIKASRPKAPLGEINREIEELWAKVPAGLKDAKVTRYNQQMAVYQAWVKANETGQPAAESKPEEGTVKIDNATGEFVAPNIKVPRPAYMDPDDGPSPAVRAAGFGLLGLAAAALVVQTSGGVPVPNMFKRFVPASWLPQNDSTLVAKPDEEEEAEVEEYEPVPPQDYLPTAAEPMEIDYPEPEALAGGAVADAPAEADEQEAAPAGDEADSAAASDLTPVGLAPVEVVEEAAEDDKDAFLAAPGEDAPAASMVVAPEDAPEGDEAVQEEQELATQDEQDVAVVGEASEEAEERDAVASSSFAVEEAEEDSAPVSAAADEEADQAEDLAMQAAAEKEEELFPATLYSPAQEEEEEQQPVESVAAVDAQEEPMSLFERLSREQAVEEDIPQAVEAAAEEEEEQESGSASLLEQEEEEEDSAPVVAAAEGADEEEDAPAWNPVLSATQEEDAVTVNDEAGTDAADVDDGVVSLSAQEEEQQAAAVRALGLKREVAAPCLASIIDSVLAPEGATPGRLPKEIAEPCLAHITTLLTPVPVVEEVVAEVPAAAAITVAEEVAPGWSPVLEEALKQEPPMEEAAPVLAAAVVEEVAVPASEERLAPGVVDTAKGAIPVTTYGAACTCPPK